MKALKWFEENEHKILNLYEAHSQSPKATWQALGEPGELKFNTFKSILPVYAALHKRFEERIVELNPEATPPGQVPVRFKGWGVRKKKGRYFEIFKRLNGRAKTLYIGKEWNEKTAREKIKELELNQ